MKFSWEQRGWPAQGALSQRKGNRLPGQGLWGWGIRRERWLSAPSPWSSYFGWQRGCHSPGHGNGWTRLTRRQWLGQSTWASPGDWLGSVASWKEARHCFRGVWAAGTPHNAGSGGCQGQPAGNPTILELVYCFNDPTVDPPGNRPANERRRSWHPPKGSLSGQLPWRRSGCVV